MVLKNHPYAQCYVTKYDDGSIYFTSYRTLVITADKLADGSFDIGCSGTYSPTTRKQIGWFLREYFPRLSYFDIKAIAYTDKTINYR